MSIKRLVVFGDSLLDAGNIIKTLGMPAEPFYKGRFSNGIISTEYLADFIAQDQRLDKLEHKSYAIGGALTHGCNPSSLLKDHAFAVSDQLVRFENEEGRFLSDDLVVINGGANNFMFAFYKEIPYINLTFKLRVARDLKKITRKAIQMGARNIIVWNIPNITNAPLYKKYLSSWLGKIFRSYLHMNINLQNGLLRKSINNLQVLFPNLNIKFFDFYALLNDCIDRPTNYGFENVRDVCVDSYGGTDSFGNIQSKIDIVGDPDKYLCWDHCHPTTRGHKVLAQGMFKLLNNN